MFCPWNVVSYVSAVLYDEEEEPQNFWANTSSNAILDDFVNHGIIDASEKFEILLNGGTITEDVCEELTYDRIHDSEKNLWSVMLMEFKRSRQESSLDADCDEAIAQIFDHGYDRTLPEGYEQQIIYGIAFYAKIARVKLVK